MAITIRLCLGGRSMGTGFHVPRQGRDRRRHLAVEALFEGGVPPIRSAATSNRYTQRSTSYARFVHTSKDLDLPVAHDAKRSNRRHLHLDTGQSVHRTDDHRRPRLRAPTYANHSQTLLPQATATITLSLLMIAAEINRDAGRHKSSPEMTQKRKNRQLRDLRASRSPNCNDHDPPNLYSPVVRVALYIRRS